MEVIISIIIWISVFMFLVIIHELGHFIIAKKSWVKVLEFGIWIPPKLFTYYTDKEWTQYTLNALPLWWFVRLKWEDPNNEVDFMAKDSFITTPLWKKIIILVWGVGMNLIFAWLFFTIAFWKGIEPLQVIPENMLSTKSQSYLMPSYSFLDEQWFISWSKIAVPVKVQDILPKEIMPDTIWNKIWIHTWDIILTINWEKVDSTNMSTILSKNIWKEINIEIKRWYQQITMNSKCPDDGCFFWIIYSSGGEIEYLPIKFWLRWAMIAWLHEIKAQTVLTFTVLWSLWKDISSWDKEKAKKAVSKLSWPVWAVKMIEVIIKFFWWWMVIAFAWLISLALAIFNILPIPALDGWRLIWVIIQSILKTKPEKYFVYENYINMIMFFILLWLWIYIILLDLSRHYWITIPWLW